MLYNFRLGIVAIFIVGTIYTMEKTPPPSPLIQERHAIGIQKVIKKLKKIKKSTKRLKVTVEMPQETIYTSDKE